MATSIVAGSNTPANIPPSTDTVRAGAQALQELVKQIGDISNDTCSRHLDDDVDTRDYVAMSDLIVRSIDVNFCHHDAGHRQGYLRALADLLAIVADGCGPVFGEWDPIENTARAFGEVSHG